MAPPPLNTLLLTTTLVKINSVIPAELLYEVHQVCLSDNQPLYCLWIYRLKANNSSYGLPNSISTTTLASYNSYAVDEICSMLNSASVLDASQADTMSPVTYC